jgi:hypothetical protein
MTQKRFSVVRHVSFGYALKERMNDIFVQFCDIVVTLSLAVALVASDGATVGLETHAPDRPDLLAQKFPL